MQIAKPDPDAWTRMRDPDADRYTKPDPDADRVCDSKAHENAR